MKVERTNILLTIAIPTYNRKKLLKRALESIIPQMNSKIEILVSDNASDDGTDDMISAFFPMVRYIKNEINMGWDYNFLQCYREARGKYVILFGSDDRMTVGSIDYLTDFLEKNDCDLVFMNYRAYDITRKEEYIKNSERIKNYKSKQDIITTNRNLFMKYAKSDITFMSATVVKRLLVSGVKDPERFFGTDFIHTCIMFEAVRGKQIIFGVIMQILLEANVTVGDSEMSKTPEKTFTVFGKHMYYILCDHAVECGFQKKQMKYIYLQYLRKYPFWKQIVSFRCHNNEEALKCFWNDGYDVVKHYPVEWIKTMIAALSPLCIVNKFYGFYKTMKKNK